MNDFTKEELNFIWQRLAITDYSNFKDMTELPNKVCSMIDNYCEHNWDIKIYNKNPGDFKCIKCGSFLNE